MSFLQNWFRQLPTAGKLMLLLSAAILPLGLVLVAAASNGIEQANNALSSRANDQGRLAVRAIDSLIARNVLALRIAANGALDGAGDPCERVSRALSAAPGTPSSFLLSDPLGTQLCTRGEPDNGGRPTLLVAPGQVRMWLVPERGRLFYKVGVFGGSATGSLDREQFRAALSAARAGTAGLDLMAGGGSLQVSDEGERSGGLIGDTVVERFEQAIAGGQVQVAVDVPIDHIASADRLLLLLPLLMWIVAALLSWLVVRTFLLTPLKRISQSIAAHEPGQGPLQLPTRLGSSVEIRELGASFTRAVERIEQSERDMGEALEGQRKLVREVHHRVKNNLQVVASLLNIHRRSAKSEDAQNAYSAIGRRVDALAVVHRNHFAELEENRGIALRPLISELASNLRGSAPESARRLDINLDLESLNTTQDVAVATAFLTTEIVEHAMLTRPDAPVTLTLRRSSELTGRFTLATGALSPEIASQATRHPMMPSVSGHCRSPAAVMVAGPLPSVETTAAAAPSPKRAVATSAAGSSVSSRIEMEQVSTQTNSHRVPGSAAARRAAVASPLTPPAQPRPKTGTRRTSRRKPSLGPTRASRLGVAMPVVDTNTMPSMSAGWSPAFASAPSAASSNNCSDARR